MKRFITVLLSFVMILSSVSPISASAFTEVQGTKEQKFTKYDTAFKEYEKVRGEQPILFWTPLSSITDILWMDNVAWSGNSKDYAEVYYDIADNRLKIAHTERGGTFKEHGDYIKLEGDWIQEILSIESVEDLGYLGITSADEPGWDSNGKFDPTKNALKFIVKEKDKLEYKYVSEGDKGHYRDKRYMYKSIYDVLEYVSGKYLDTKDEAYLVVIEGLLRLQGDICETTEVHAAMMSEKETVTTKEIRKTGERTETHDYNMAIYVDVQGLMMEVGYYPAGRSNRTFESLPNFTNVLKGVVKDSLVEYERNSSTIISIMYPSIYEVYSKLQEEEEALIEEKKEQDRNQARLQFETDYKGWDSASEYDRWAMAFKYWMINDGAFMHEQEVEIVPSVAEYNLKELQNVNLSDNTGRHLRVEEYERLVTYIKNVLMYDDQTLPELEYKGTTRVENERGFTETTVYQNAKATVDKFADYTATDAATLRVVAKEFASIAKYLTAKVYGYSTGDIFEVQNEIALNYLQRSVYLDSIIPKNLQKVQTLPLSYAYAPKPFKNIKFIEKGEDAHEAYRELVYTVMLIDSWLMSEDMSGLRETSEVDDSGEKVYVNDEIAEFISTRKEGSLTELSYTAQNQAIIYKSIYEGCEYLGLEVESPRLKAVVDYWKSLVKYNDVLELDRVFFGDATYEPLRQFFLTDTQEFSYYYNLGVALSATHVPMQTNVYEIKSLDYLEDPNFIDEFHYAYGFYRKALYIDTDMNAAVNRYIKGYGDSSTRPATLQDLLDCERDIVLYIDDNFYNVNKLADLQGYKYNKLDNTKDADTVSDDTSMVEDIGSAIKQFFVGKDISIEEIIKTGTYSNYSNNVRKEASAYTTDKTERDSETGLDYVLGSAAIDNYLTVKSDDPSKSVYDEYTPLQSFAVTSAVYRNQLLYNKVKNQTYNPTPVFVSSPNLAGMEGIGKGDWNSIYNYIMLKNLEGNMSVDYKTTLDLESNIYMDIYGNILTESGLVIIPAASNPSIQRPDSYNVYTAGFLSLCDNGYELPADFGNVDKFVLGESANSSSFKLNEETETLQVKSKSINNYFINFRDLPIADPNTMKTLLAAQTATLARGSNMNFDQRAYLITEVLRGAPIEHINKAFEGLNKNNGIQKYSVYLGYKLEELAENLFSTANGNSLLTFPNLAYMDNYEVIMMFLYKMMVVVAGILLFVKIYLDVVKRGFGLKAIWKFITTIVGVVFLLYIVPIVIDYSYYAPNKALLQDEMSYIAALNLEKHNEGKEIKMSSVSAPETNSVLYLKLENIAVPWYEAVDSILSADAFETMDEIYDKALENRVLAKMPGVVVKNNGLYIDVITLFDSTSIYFDQDSKTLVNITTDTPYTSYVSPYYLVLDTLVERINTYNRQLENESGEKVALAFTQAVQSKGVIRTKGLIKSYFESTEFMLSHPDITGLRDAYGFEKTYKINSVLDDEGREAIKRSIWYSEYEGEALAKQISKIENSAREFVVKNRGLLGKVTDETFLKIMALSIATEHNNLFHIGVANGIEMYDVDTRDIMRLSLASRGNVLKDSSKSFVRFVYDETGSLGTVAVMALVLVYFLVSFIKPIFTIVVLVTSIAAVIISRLFKKTEDHVIQGFFISLSLLCAVNMLYALCIKGTMLLATTGCPTLVNVFVQIIIQLAYLAVLVLFLRVIIRDWKDLGMNAYEKSFAKVLAKAMNINGFSKLPELKVISPKIAGDFENARRNMYYNRHKKTAGYKGSQILDMMKQRDSNRASRRRK